MKRMSEVAMNNQLNDYLQLLQNHSQLLYSIQHTESVAPQNMTNDLLNKIYIKLSSDFDPNCFQLVFPNFSQNAGSWEKQNISLNRLALLPVQTNNKNDQKILKLKNEINENTN